MKRTRNSEKSDDLQHQPFSYVEKSFEFLPFKILNLMFGVLKVKLDMVVFYPDAT